MEESFTSKMFISSLTILHLFLSFMLNNMWQIPPVYTGSEVSHCGGIQQGQKQYYPGRKTVKRLQRLDIQPELQRKDLDQNVCMCDLVKVQT